MLEHEHARPATITMSPPQLGLALSARPIHHNSRYGAKFYAFTLKPPNDENPSNDRCYQVLSKAGWEVLPQDPPLYPTLIQEPEGSGSILKNTIGSDGCCVDKELIKLTTYTLTDLWFFWLNVIC